MLGILIFQEMDQDELYIIKLILLISLMNLLYLNFIFYGIDKHFYKINKLIYPF